MSFWERRKFFDAYGSRASERLAKLPPGGMRVTCPCCGYLTMHGATGEICDLCDWEDDGQDDHHADEIRVGSNSPYSLVAARQNFESYLVMYPPAADRRASGPDSYVVKKIKQSIMAAFDQMMSEPPPDELDALWRVIEAGERALARELKLSMAGPLYEPLPCPYCGEPLRTAVARQCRFCGSDWHDPDHVIKLPGF